MDFQPVFSRLWPSQDRMVVANWSFKTSFEFHLLNPEYVGLETAWSVSSILQSLQVAEWLEQSDLQFVEENSTVWLHPPGILVFSSWQDHGVSHDLRPLKESHPVFPARLPSLFQLGQNFADKMPVSAAKDLAAVMAGDPVFRDLLLNFVHTSFSIKTVSKINSE